LRRLRRFREIIRELRRLLDPRITARTNTVQLIDCVDMIMVTTICTVRQY